MCPCPGAAFRPSPDSPLARPERPLHWWLCPQRSACVDGKAGPGWLSPTRDPQEPPQLQSCVPGPGVGSLGWRRQALSHASSSFLLTATLPGGEALGGPGGGAPSQTTYSVLGPLQSGQARACPPGKDRTAPGKGWEDPELQAGEWKLVAAPLASREVQALVLRPKGLKLTTWPRCVWRGSVCLFLPRLGPGAHSH